MKDDMTSLYSVRDVLKYAPDIKCIVSPGSLPSEEYAIYRFLFALLTDAYQIENDDDILDIWEAEHLTWRCSMNMSKDRVMYLIFLMKNAHLCQCPVKTALEYGATPAAAAVLNWGAVKRQYGNFFQTWGLPIGKNL